MNRLVASSGLKTLLCGIHLNLKCGVLSSLKCGVMFPGVKKKISSMELLKKHFCVESFWILSVESFRNSNMELF